MIKSCTGICRISKAPAAAAEGRTGGTKTTKSRPADTDTIVVLAAGKGSRFGGAKQFEPVTPNGETILDFSIYDAIRAGFRKAVFVVRQELLNETRLTLQSKWSGLIETAFICQDAPDFPEKHLNVSRNKPFGTGHALLTAKSEVNGNFCMINADDFYGSSSFEKMSKWKSADDESEFLMIGYRLGNTLSSFGPVSRGQCKVNKNGYLQSVLERKKILSENGAITCDDHDDVDTYLDLGTTVSMNFWGFSPRIFEFLKEGFERFLVEYESDETAEFYIIDAVNDAVSKGRAAVRVLRSDDEWVGITYREDLNRVKEKLQGLKDEGIYPGKLW